jgi:hypothetical protein
MDPAQIDLIRALEKLIKDLSVEEDEEIMCILEFVRQEAVCPYGDSDDVTASIALSKLPSTD